MGQQRESYQERTKRLDALLGVGRSLDMVSRDLVIGTRRARLWVVNGYMEDSLLERMIDHWLTLPELDKSLTAEDFVARCVSVCDAKAEADEQKALTAVFSGKTLLVVEHMAEDILLDVKTYPARSVEEPDNSKVLRGSHDGFLETLMKNAALLRRRIRTPELTIESHKIGTQSHTDVALCYLESRVDRKLLETIRQQLAGIDVNSVSMSQESIAEAIVGRQWYNPFPRVRYTERPDTAAASVMEGNILLMVDNTPAVMILPTTIFSFTEAINDYYFPPLVGTYLRLVRLVVSVLTLLITPLWFLLIKSPETVPEKLGFLAVEGEYFVPLIVQLLLLEFVIDLLKLASLNTPDVLSNSFSMLGALILGDFAVQARWLVPEVLVYMAFVAIANFAQPSYELGYALKLMRMLLLVLTYALDWVGFVAGLTLTVILIVTTRPIGGKGYLYPLIPFNARAMRALLTRRPISRENT
ncbi:MAG: spore germination protein [Clostridiales bacterium]|nr:spore germination protein [Clostridiales bacterium]